MTNKTCLGCGLVLQDNQPTKKGYVKSMTQDYCMSCYQLKHYGIAKEHLHPESLPNIKPKSLVLMISSILHIDLLFSYPVWRYQSDATYIYIINQVDLLPKQTNLDFFFDQIVLKAKKEQIPFEQIIFMSAKNKQDCMNLANLIKTYDTKDVYLLGVQNSGKTTLFKALTGDSHALAFKKAGLTQEVLSKKVDEITYYDMPGLYQKGYLHAILPYDTYKILIPSERIRPKIYQMTPKIGLLLEGLIGISYQGGPKTFVFFVDNQLNIHKANVNQIEKRIDQREEALKIFAQDYQKTAYKLAAGKHHVTFADMGFLHVEGPITLELYHPKHLHISITEALFK